MWRILLLCASLTISSWAHVGQFWHISDIHYDGNYTLTGNRERMCWQTDGNPSLRHPDGRYGDEFCDAPWLLVESAVKTMKTVTGENIEFILWTGDSSSHANDELLSQEKVLSAVRNVTDLLNREFPTSFVYAVLGNHDCYPNHHCPPGPSPIYDEIANMWQQWLPIEALESFRKGGYYTIERSGSRLRFVALNTVLYSRQNRLTYDSTIDDPAGQFAWFEDVLKKSRRKRETVFIFGHIAPGANERYQGGIFQDRFNKRFLTLINKYSDVIVGQFFGHNHKDSFRIYYDDRGKPVSYLLLAPSVTPIGFDRRAENTANNPGIRLVKFETDTGEVYDYSQYSLNLTQANQKNHASWRVEYNLTFYYALPNVSAASLHELANTMSSNRDVFDRYYLANTVQWEPPDNCDMSCRHQHLCAIRNLDYEAFQGCVKTMQTLVGSGASHMRSHVPATSITLPPVTLALILTCLRTWQWR